MKDSKGDPIESSRPVWIGVDHVLKFNNMMAHRRLPKSVLILETASALWPSTARVSSSHLKTPRASEPKNPLTSPKRNKTRTTTHTVRKIPSLALNLSLLRVRIFPSNPRFPMAQ